MYKCILCGSAGVDCPCLSVDPCKSFPDPQNIYFRLSTLCHLPGYAFLFLLIRPLIFNSGVSMCKPRNQG